VSYRELWWVEKAARVQAARGNEVTPLCATIGKVEPEIGGAETAVRSGDRTLGVVTPSPERVVTLITTLVFSPYSAGGAPVMTPAIRRNPEGIWLEKTLLCWSVMGCPSTENEFSRDRPFREKPVGIRGNTGRGQGNERTQRGTIGFRPEV